MHDWLSMSWKALLARGVMAVIFGIVAMAYPVSTVIAFVVLWGMWALIDSAGSFAQAFDKGTSASARLALLLMGVIALAAALFAFFRPGTTAVTLTWILGIWLIVRGTFELAGAVKASGATAKLLLVISAALDGLLGILFVANPGRAALGLAVVLGIVALAWGVVFIVTAVLVRRDQQASAVPAATV